MDTRQPTGRDAMKPKSNRMQPHHEPASAVEPRKSFRHAMKSKPTAPVLYKWAQATMAAERLAIWTFANLLNPQKPHAEAYPLNGASFLWLQDGSWGITLPKQKNLGRSKPVSESEQIQREMKAISAQLRKDANLLKGYFSHSIIAEDLGRAIGRLNRLLADLAGKGARAMELFTFHSLESVIELEKLSFREDTFPLIQAEASKQSMWPVPYSPHPRRKRELDQVMQKIGLGKRNFQKLQGARWTDKSVAGKFAHRMGMTLYEIHFRGSLNRALRRPAAANPKQWEKHLLAIGWRTWMIRLSQLPELTQTSAPAWFEVGWAALKDATGGKVLSVPELASLGKSNADYGRRKAATKRGQLSSQASRVEDQIKSLVRKAFFKRFGNPA